MGAIGDPGLKVHKLSLIVQNYNVCFICSFRIGLLKSLLFKFKPAGTYCINFAQLRIV